MSLLPARLLPANGAATSAAPRSRRAVITWRDGRAFVARHENLVTVRWTGVPGASQLAALGAAHAAAAREGDVLLISHVAEIGGPVTVDAAARTRMLELIATCRDRTSAVAHVIEVPGAIGIAVRTFLRALEQIAGPGRTETAVFTGVDDAARWLTAHARGERRTPGEIGAACPATTARA